MENTTDRDNNGSQKTESTLRDRRADKQTSIVAVFRWLYDVDAKQHSPRIPLVCW